MKKAILPLILTNLMGGMASAVMIYISGGDPVWIGTLLTTLPVPFILLIATNVFGIARTSAKLPIAQLLSLAGVALVLGTLYSRGIHTTADYIALGLALYGALFVQWFIRVFSSYGRKKSPAIAKGQRLPEVPLKQLDGTEITSDSFAGSKTLIVFFRANWCPFCMNQLKEVRAKADRLTKSTVKVKFISNQGIANSTRLAEKLNLPADFEILQDEDLRAAKALGVADIGGAPAGMPGYPADTVMATVIALDEKGTVLFGDETDNYRVRPHPDTFLDVFLTS